MSESEQILILYPKEELHFKGSFDEVMMAYIKITNSSDRQICFKVKTTDADWYCVWPNKGLLEPLSTTYIAVLLESIDLNRLSEGTKHLFVIQTMFAPEGQFDLDELWKEADPQSIMKSKLNCVFDITNHLDEKTGRSSLAEDNNPVNPYNVEEANNEWNVIQELLAENKHLKQELLSIRSEGLMPKEELPKNVNNNLIFEEESSILSYILKLKPNPDYELTSGQFGFAIVLVIVGVIIGKVFI